MSPEVKVTGLDEDAVLAAALAASPGLAPSDQVLVLAKAKAQAADAALRAESAGADRLVLGCDSMLELDGEVLGKPDGPEDAFRRIRQQAGRSATLHTGHWLIGRGKEVGGTSSTVVHFGQMSDAEIRAYVATGEPLHVAGAFTIDGLGGPFIDGIEGDHHGVVGLSLPLFRGLVAQVGLTIPDLWG
jgi:septum formation protein